MRILINPNIVNFKKTSTEHCFHFLYGYLLPFFNANLPYENVYLFNDCAFHLLLELSLQLLTVDPLSQRH